METFLTHYCCVKRAWSATVDKSSQGSVKNLMNGLLWDQQISSFDPSEWGELSDFAGLQEGMQKANAAQIDKMAAELAPVVAALESIVNWLGDMITAMGLITQFHSMKPDLLCPYLEQLTAAYATKLKLRRQIVSDLLAHQFDEAPHNVITTITAM
jgi:hypothetical protein